MKKMQTLPLLATVSLLFLSLDCLNAANYTVVMGPSGLIFNPASISVNQGDSVTWTNESLISHTATSGTVPTPDFLWNSGSFGSHGTFTVDFSFFATNTYPYYCTIHGAAMTGTLTVTNAAPEPPPSLSNARLSAGQFHFNIDGLVGQKYAVQSSPDSITWTSISTNLAISTSASVTDPFASNAPTSVYRVLELH
jgi:plastocyanin